MLYKGVKTSRLIIMMVIGKVGVWATTTQDGGARIFIVAYNFGSVGRSLDTSSMFFFMLMADGS